MEEDRSFLRGHFAEIPGGSVLGHTTPAITRAAERLAKKYAGVPWIESIAPKLGEPTQNKGGRKKKKKGIPGWPANGSKPPGVTRNEANCSSRASPPCPTVDATS